MKRGDVYWVNFDPSVGGEIKKKRPAIIISNNAANKVLNRIQVVPITSKVSKLYPGEAYVTCAGRQAKAMADQLTTVSKIRLFDKLDTLDNEDLKQVERAIKLQLGLFEVQ